MSLFLGKIHYWLFNKITWFEGIEEEIQNMLENKGYKVDEWIAEIYNKYGEPTEKKPLEDMIDTSNIHGWLQEKITSAESRQAALITKGVKEIGESFLESVKEIYIEKGKKNAEEYLNEGNSIESPAEAFTAVNNFILDGMPCDRVNEIVENSEEHIVWQSTMDIHGQYWNIVGGNVNSFYELRDEWIKAFVENLRADYKFNKISEDTREISL
ncbi:hypothetical protein [Clostridium sp. YIM B02551]|uniref:hypothetical protein n=1 Tax=Clostridium sp. YIM B02551 TaxID=2910679 RepID=UPI001EEBB230|nr:hypothetical protein [Clostridium sp. YIM B02551]